MSEESVNKILSVVLITVIIIMLGVTAIFHAQLPDIFYSVVSLVLGYVVHSLGVADGATLQAKQENKIQQSTRSPDTHQGS